MVDVRETHTWLPNIWMYGFLPYGVKFQVTVVNALLTLEVREGN